MESLEDAELRSILVTLSQMVQSQVDAFVKEGETVQSAQELVMQRLIGNNFASKVESEDDVVDLMSSGYLRRAEATRALAILRHLQDLALKSNSVHDCILSLNRRLDKLPAELPPRVSARAASSCDNNTGKCSSRRASAKRKNGSVAKKNTVLENKERFSKIHKFCQVCLGSSDSNIEHKKKRRRLKKSDRLNYPS